MIKRKMHIISENAETNNIRAARNFLKKDPQIRNIAFMYLPPEIRGYDTLDSREGEEAIKEAIDKKIEAIRRAVPNVRLGEYKFLLGVCMYYSNTQDGFDATDLNVILRYMTQPGFIENFPREIGMPFNELKSYFNPIIEKDRAEKLKQIQQSGGKVSRNYNIVPINSFEEAKSYYKYCAWCICVTPYAFDSYVKPRFVPGTRKINRKKNHFYFLLEEGFENTEKERGPEYPLDDYGLSMIAVLLNSEGHLVSAFTRWNDPEHGDNGNLIDEVKLSEILGKNFYDVFKKSRSKKAIINEETLVKIVKEVIKEYLEIKKA